MSKELFEQMREQELAAETTPFLAKDPHHIIQDQLISLTQQVEDGTLSVLDGLIEIDAHKRELEKSLELVKSFKNTNIDTIEAEAKEYEGKYRGHEISVRSGGKIFNYTGIPEWVDAETNKKAIEAKYKSMWEAKQKGAVHAHVSADGEELTLPTITYRKSSIIVKPNV